MFNKSFWNVDNELSHVCHFELLLQEREIQRARIKSAPINHHACFKSLHIPRWSVFSTWGCSVSSDHCGSLAKGFAKTKTQLLIPCLCCFYVRNNFLQSVLKTEFFIWSLDQYVHMCLQKLQDAFACNNLNLNCGCQCAVGLGSAKHLIRWFTWVPE